MKITVQRKTLTPQSTQGEMFLDGLFECYSLEPRDRKFAPTSITDGGSEKPYAIPAGTYPWRKYQSPELGYEDVLIEDVPGFTGVEIHIGNFPRNTKGCTLVGSVEQQDFVGHSKEEFGRLMLKLPASGQITYLDPPAAPADPLGQANQS